MCGIIEYWHLLYVDYVPELLTLFYISLNPLNSLTGYILLFAQGHIVGPGTTMLFNESGSKASG